MLSVCYLSLLSQGRYRMNVKNMFGGLPEIIRGSPTLLHLQRILYLRAWAIQKLIPQEQAADPKTLTIVNVLLIKPCPLPSAPAFQQYFLRIRQQPDKIIAV